MTKFLMGLQIVALMAQGTPDLVGVIPPKWHPVFHFVVSAIQALAGWVQKDYDPQGVKTPAPANAGGTK